jgi:hypothetical protein
MRFYERTKDVMALKDMLRHANLRTIQKSVHINRDRVRGAMKVYEMGLVPVTKLLALWWHHEHKSTESGQTS